VKSATAVLHSLLVT